jgi:hypothetical protein
MTHWDFLLKEAFWMAKDFGQVRLQSKQPASQPPACCWPAVVEPSGWLQQASNKLLGVSHF